MKDNRNTIEFRKDGLYINNIRKNLYSGNIDFFRTHTLYWEKMFSKIKEFGFDTICAYISWDLSKTSDCEFDFEGKTDGSRNFILFLELCKKYNFDLILRPGPFIQCELETWGVPEECVKLERLQPEFLNKVFKWLSAVNKVVINYQKTKGGPIILYQADNEFFFPHSLNFDIVPKKGIDNKSDYQRDFIFGKFNLWFDKVKDSRYGNLKNIQNNIKQIIAKKDFNFFKLSSQETGVIFDFIDSYMVEYFKKYVEAVRKQGIEIPIIANIGQFLLYYDWRRLLNIVDSVGIDIYFPNLFPNNQYYTLEWYCKVAKAIFPFLWSPEFQCGIWAGNEDLFGVITPKHHDFLNKSSLALGVRGFNIYTFVERDEWHYSAISSMGKVREKYADTYLKFGEIFKNITSQDPISDLGLVWDLVEHRNFIASKYKDWAEILYNYPFEFELPKENTSWWEIFTFLIDKDIDFEIIDIRDIQLSPKKALIMVGDNSYYNNHQDVIKKYISDGKKVYLIDFGKNTLKKIYMSKDAEKTETYPNYNPDLLNKLLCTDITLNYVKTNKKKLRSVLYKEKENLYYLFVINWSDKEINFLFKFDEILKDILTGYQCVDMEDIEKEEDLYNFIKAEKKLDGKSTMVFRIYQK